MHFILVVSETLERLDLSVVEILFFYIVFHVKIFLQLLYQCLIELLNYFVLRLSQMFLPLFLQQFLAFYFPNTVFWCRRDLGDIIWTRNHRTLSRTFIILKLILVSVSRFFICNLFGFWTLDLLFICCFSLNPFFSVLKFLLC